jgi:hypothetical protein
MQTQFVEQDDKVIVNRLQDCTPILENCKALSDFEQKGEMKLAARIPYIVIETYINDNKITMQEFMNNNEHIKRLVNSPDLKHFRVWNGRV